MGPFLTSQTANVTAASLPPVTWPSSLEGKGGPMLMVLLVAWGTRVVAVVARAFVFRRLVSAPGLRDRTEAAREMRTAVFIV